MNMKKKYLIHKYSDEEQRELANILKTKRIELGKNLDEVASGVCSTSYLSRIENNLVRLQEPYLKMLFEKLDIDYETLKENRKNNLFVEIVKKVLLGYDKEYTEELEKIMALNCYLGTERDLILLYDNILKNNYEETQYVIDKLQEICNHFTNSEMIFFMYLVALYYYKTNQTTLAYHQVRILSNVKIDDEIIDWVVKELSMDIYYLVGNKADYIMLYASFVKNAPLPYFNDLLIKQKMKMITIEAESNYEVAIHKMEEYHENLATFNQDIQNEYYYHLSIIDLIHGKYQEVIHLLMKRELTTPMVKILSIALLYIEREFKNKEVVLNVLNNYNFTKYDDLIKNICYYATTKFENHSDSPSKSLNFLKNNVFNLLNSSFDQMIYEHILKEMIHLYIRCSKYKESCNLILKVFDGLKNKILNN